MEETQPTPIQRQIEEVVTNGRGYDFNESVKRIQSGAKIYFLNSKIWLQIAEGMDSMRKIFPKESRAQHESQMIRILDIPIREEKKIKTDYCIANTLNEKHVSDKKIEEGSTLQEYFKHY